MDDSKSDMVDQRNRSTLRKGRFAFAALIILTLTSIFFNFPVFTFTPHQMANARVDTTRANLKQLHSAVLSFKMDTGRYPNKDEGLTALVENPNGITGWDPASAGKTG